MDRIDMLAGVIIPSVPGPYTHHPISVSRKPQRYRPYQLTDIASAETEWVGFFEQVLLGIFWKTKRAVPFVFRTANGEVRSLDAGCVKFLRNRIPSEIDWTLDARSGFIESVVPTLPLMERYSANQAELIASVTWHATR